MSVPVRKMECGQEFMIFSTTDQSILKAAEKLCRAEGEGKFANVVVECRPSKYTNCY